MSTNAYRGAVLGIVAALLLANPAYVGLVMNEPRERSPTGYTATAITPTNASDQRTVVNRLGEEEVLTIAQLEDANEYSPYGPRYEAPGRAADSLRTAVETGTARTTGDDVTFTLRRVGANYRYLRTHGDESDAARYHRFDVARVNGSTVVTTTRVNRSTVAQYLVYKDARLYTALPEYQRETVDEVIAADEYGYRPYNDEFHEITESVVVKDGTYYVFTVGVHVDDFGPSTKTVVSLLLAALGTLALVASIVFTLLATRERRDG